MRLSTLLALTFLVSIASAQHKPAATKGVPESLVPTIDPFTVAFAEDWVPEPFVRNGNKPDAPFVSGPLRCSECELDGRYVADAKLPDKAERFVKRPSGDILGWWAQDEYKLKPLVITTEHAQFVIQLPPCPGKALKPDERAFLEGHLGKIGATVTPHQRAHLFVYRYLRQEARFLDLVGLRKGTPNFQPPMPKDHLGCRGRSEIYVFPIENAYREFGKHFFGLVGKWMAWWYFQESDSMVSAIHAAGVEDPVLAARFDHMLAHHFLFQYRSFWHHMPVWFYEGLGHYFERRHAEFEDTHCLLGHYPDWVYLERDWWNATRNMVSKNDDLPLADISRLIEFHDLRPEKRPQAWSLVSFQIALGKPRFRKFLDQLKSKTENESLPEATYRAFETAYGVDMITFQKAWRAWALGQKPNPKVR